MSSQLKGGEGQPTSTSESQSASDQAQPESKQRASYQSRRPESKRDVADSSGEEEARIASRRWWNRCFKALLIVTPLAVFFWPKKTRQGSAAEPDSATDGEDAAMESENRASSPPSGSESVETTEPLTRTEAPSRTQRGYYRPRRPRPAFRGGESLPALRMVETPRSARLIGKFIWTLIIILPFAMLLLPWRQSVSGNGRVIGFHPLDRPFTIEAPIDGQVIDFRVSEGDYVQQGDVIMQIQDIDPQYLDTLKQQLELTRDQLNLAEDSVLAFEQVIQQLEDARQQQLEAAKAAIEVAEQRITEVERQQDQTNVSRAAAKQKRERWQQLFEKGLVSRQEAEFAERDYLELEARLQQLAALLQSAKVERAAAEARLQEVDARTLSEISKAEADYQAAQAQARSIDNRVEEYKIEIRRQETQMIRAPRSGTVLRLLTNLEAGAQVRATDPLMILTPEAPNMSVELYLLGRDIPLVQPGDPVRLQFDGWPAVQFVGWPSVAIGTFGGRVAVVDSQPTHKGLFRVLVLPDGDLAWPTQRFLRQGAQARGWVLLRRVSLGFELWRRINGFPPIVAFEEPTGEEDYSEPRDNE